MKSAFLKELSIRNLGVIESANLEFSPGLNVITGETGAGKTMVFTALSLLTGAKADVDLIRVGSEKMVISGIFQLNDELASLANELDAEVNDGEVILTRVISSQGKSKSTLGGVPITNAALVDFADQLIEIHSQSSHFRFEKESFQRELLDKYAELDNPLFAQCKNQYHSSFLSAQALVKKINELSSLGKGALAQIEYLEALIKDCEKVSPTEDEWEEINQELIKLDSVESIAANLNVALAPFDADENNVITALSQSAKALAASSSADSSLAARSEDFSDLISQITELSRDLRRYLDNLEADPARFAFLQERKAALQQLWKKYSQSDDRNAGINEVIEIWQGAREVIADLSGGSDRIATLEKELHANLISLYQFGVDLAEHRRSAGEKLANLCKIELEKLGLADAAVKFEIAFKTTTAESIKDFSPEGIDTLSFLFKSFGDAKFLPIGKVASGGELSRIFLALEVALAQISPLPIYLFDEVDAGIGGKTGLIVGERCAWLADNFQVFLVTHLPQVAIWADKHFAINKSTDGAIASSDVTEVAGEAQITEIARLLAGEEGSKSAREHALELLEMAKRSKAEMK